MQLEHFINNNNKIRNRVLSYGSESLKKRIESVNKINYDLFEHSNSPFLPINPVFTIILTIYDSNFNYIKDSINSCLAQTYQNLELIIVDNGTTGKIKSLIEQVFLHNKNVKIIRTFRNEFDPFQDDFNDPISNLWNAGLFSSIGDYVYFLSYDDMISDNYVDSMVTLYLENPNCITAAPLVASINERNEINQEISKNLENNNVRERYTNGIELARGYMNKDGTILFPGGLLSSKSELVLSLGGFDNMNDWSQVFKFAINGESGFDKTAFLYWRHHSNQTNKLQKKFGLIYYKNCINFYNNYKISELHKTIAGDKFSDEFRVWYNMMTLELVTSSVRDSLEYGLTSYLNAMIRLRKEGAPLKYYFIVIIKLPSDLKQIVYSKLNRETLYFKVLKSLYRKLKNS
jgi:glycosyltransferase involved in cell wall biosynthesis